ncbi:MucR family transcriptional regulator [Azospirillum melinis]|uniref:MucR family transcriptional regulator n=1 Tax=Azospirillum melinis TaxID=328839 RepID=UPI0037579FDF
MENLDPQIALTAQIVGAFLGNNAVSTADLPKLITSVHDALTNLGNAQVAEPMERPTPAVPIKKSVTPDFIVCLEDGKKLKMLKRYLRTKFDMSPEEYRARWGLPPDYPMVAPNYAEARSSLARANGLGRKGRVAAE